MSDKRYEMRTEAIMRESAERQKRNLDPAFAKAWAIRERAIAKVDAEEQRKKELSIRRTSG